MQLPKFAFRVVGWVLVVNSKYFRDFLEMPKFSNMLRLKFFGDSFGNVRKSANCPRVTNMLSSLKTFWLCIDLLKVYYFIKRKSGLIKNIQNNMLF